MTLFLVLQGRYGPEGATHLTSSRIVPVDLDNASELSELKKSDFDGIEAWGLGDGTVMWRVVDAFEMVEPTEELHEHKYPMSAHVLYSDIASIVDAARAKLAQPPAPAAKDGTSWNPDDPYYMVVEEWNYPTESGREPSQLTYDSWDEAMAACHELVEAERGNFIAATGMDCLPPAECAGGVILTTKSGLDPFYYCARTIPVVSKIGGILDSVNRKAKEGGSL